jgi:hypothetical protein
VNREEHAVENDRPAAATPGAMVRAAREASGLSLADLAASTRIPVSQLLALEADDHEQLSGPLYVRSFLRSCAEALDLDPHDLLAAYDRSGPAAGAAPVAGPVWAQETEVRHAAAFPWQRVGLLAAAVLATVLVALAIVRIAGGGGDDGGGDGGSAVGTPTDPGRQRREALGDSLREAWSPLTGLSDPDSQTAAAADSARADTLTETGAVPDSSLAASAAGAAADTLAPPPPRVVVPSADELAVLADLPAGDRSLTFADGSHWPLVLRVATRGRVDYAVGVDGQRNAPDVAWLARPAGLPPEGVTAGVVYPLGWRSVSYWGARDQFLLKLSAAEDVTVTLNGRPLPIPTRLVGREWVLDRSLLDR